MPDISRVRDLPGPTNPAATEADKSAGATRRFIDTSTWFQRSHVPEAVTGLVAVWGVVLGVAFIGDSIDLARNPAWHAGGLEYATATAWGAALILVSVAVVAALLTHRRDLWWPLAFMTAWYAAWLFLGLSAITEPRTSLPSLWAYALPLVLAFFLTLVYAKTSRERR